MSYVRSKRQARSGASRDICGSTTGRLKRLAVVIVVALALTAGTAMARKAPDFADTTITGNWDGLRPKLAEKGVDFGVTVIGEGSYAAEGGINHAGTQINTTVGTLGLNLGKLIGWQGASIHLQGSFRNGHSLNDRAGIKEFTEVQNQFGGGSDRSRWNEGYFQQKLWNDKVDLKVGRLTIDSSGSGFMPLGCNTMNLTTCFAPYVWTSILDLGNNLWPASRTGMTVAVRPFRSGNGYFRVGAFKIKGEGVTRPGTLFVAAFGWHDKVNGLPGNWEIGAWRDNAKFDTADILGPYNPWTATDPGHPQVDGSSGFYGMVNQQVTKNAAGGGLSFQGFGVFDDQDSIALLDQLVGAGAIYKAPFASRPSDQVQLYVSRAHANSRFGNGQRILLSEGLPTEAYGPIGEFYPTLYPQTGYEYMTELDYSAVVHPGLILMPNIQYIANPGGISQNRNAIVIGLQLIAAL